MNSRLVIAAAGIVAFCVYAMSRPTVSPPVDPPPRKVPVTPDAPDDCPDGECPPRLPAPP